MNRSICRTIFATAIAVASMTLAAPLEAQTETWASVGSVGIVDESSTSLVLFDAGTAAFRASAPTGSVAVLRYHINLPAGQWFFNSIAGYDTFFPYTSMSLTLKFRKNDDGAYVAAALKRVRLSDGVTSTVAGVNSLAYFPSPNVQSDVRNIGCAGGCFGPEQYAYFVEAVIWKPTGTSDPKLVGWSVQAGY